MYKAANDFVGILKNIEADPDLIKKVAKNADEAAENGGKKANIGVGNPAGNKLMTKDDFYKFLDDIGSPDNKLAKWNEVQKMTDEMVNGNWNQETGKFENGLHNWGNFKRAVDDGKIDIIEGTEIYSHSSGVRQITYIDPKSGKPNIKTFLPDSWTRADYEQAGLKLMQSDTAGTYKRAEYKGVTIEGALHQNYGTYKHFKPIVKFN